MQCKIFAGLTGSKMSSSEAQTKIDLLDAPEVVEAKIRSATCSRAKKSGEAAEGEETEQNGVLAFFEFVVFAVESAVEIEGTNRSYKSIDELRDAFNSEIVSEDQLKSYLAAFLNRILAKVRDACDTDEIRDLLARAYPPPPASETSVEAEAPSGEEAAPTLDEAAAALLAELKGNAEVSARASFATTHTYQPTLFQLLISPRLLRRINAKERVRVVWRVVAKGRFHLGYVRALLELRRLYRLKCECTIVISSLGAFLDNEKCKWQAREARAAYYEAALGALLVALDMHDVAIRHASEHEFKRYF